MRTVLADTSYWIAILNTADGLHIKAVGVSQALGSFRTITTEMILSELLNYFSDRGAALRMAAAGLAKVLRDMPNVEIVPQTSLHFREALELYGKTTDKGWSLTDCASILLMRERGIAEALTSDHHFEQAGLVALLRD
jgi:predicted nucleic acid-binding protein